MTRPTVRVALPYHLRNLAGVEAEVRLEVPGPPTMQAVLAALEEAYPVLRGTIRDPATGERRAFLRFFGARQDLSLRGMDEPLPPEVASGEEPFLVVGAVAGG